MFTESLGLPKASFLAGQGSSVRRVCGLRAEFVSKAFGAQGELISASKRQDEETRFPGVKLSDLAKSERYEYVCGARAAKL